MIKSQKESKANILKGHCFTFLFLITQFIYHKTHNHINQEYS